MIDLSKLTTLVLESCSRLDTSLPLLTARAVKGYSLRSLTVRTELVDDELPQKLEAFICALTDLTDLCLLFEGDSPGVSTEQILKVHGKTLKTVFIDSRYAPGSPSEADFSESLPWDYLDSIHRYCPNIVELGVSLDWDSIVTSEFELGEV